MAVSVLRAAWRVLPGDLIGRAVLRLAHVSVTRRVTVDGVGRVDLAEDPRLGRWLDAVPRTPTAMTFGRVVLARGSLSDALVAHEAEHVRQWTALGPLYLPAYLVASAEAVLRRGDSYRANRFETAAFAAGDRVAAERAAAPAAPAAPRRLGRSRPVRPGTGRIPTQNPTRPADDGMRRPKRRRPPAAQYGDSHA